VIRAVRDHLDANSPGDRETPVAERDLVERHVERVIVQPQSLEMHFFSRPALEAGQEENDAQTESQGAPSPIVSVPWAATPIEQAKGILHSPASKPAMSDENRDMLLTAIAKARAWIDDLAEGHAASFAQIADERERRSAISGFWRRSRLFRQLLFRL
jgi:site-specific DNA recombinase